MPFPFFFFHLLFPLTPLFACALCLFLLIWPVLPKTIEKALCFLNGGTLGKGGTPSLIVVKTKKDSTDKIANCIDLTGRFHPSVYERFHGDYAKGQQEHYVGSASVYVDLDLQSVDPYRLTEDDEFLNRVQRINTVCFRGCEGVKDAKDQSFKITQLNQGHWGPNVYPGVRRVRDGENSFMKDCDYKLGLK